MRRRHSRVPRAPEGLKRQVRRRQAGTALVGVVAVVAVLACRSPVSELINRSEGTTPVDDTWTGYRVFDDEPR